MNLGVNILACAALVFLVGAGSPAFSEILNTPSIFVDSDKYKGFEDSSAQLIGHVKIIRGGEQLTSDKAFINPTKNEVTAEGNVILITPKDYVHAERMTYNFETKKGIVYNGFIQTGQETIEGEEIYKLGESEYEAKHATYTSCVNCPPAWKLSGTKIDASVGSYAYIRNPIVRIYGIPILWLPYMVIPIKTERQSGLLPPTLGTDGLGGFIFGESYFWAISRSKDATFTEISYGVRGYKTDLEYRFMSDKNSYGRFHGYFINDRQFGHDSTYLSPDVRYNPPNPLLNYLYRPKVDSITRFAIHLDEHFELPEDFVANILVNDVSDTRYPYDFPTDMPFGGESALENRISVAKNTENTHSSIDVDLYENLLRADPVGQNDDAIHRAPELRYSVMPTRIFGSQVLARIDADYIDFQRAQSAYDNLSGSATFRPETDRYRTGQRLSLHPAIAYPLNVGDIVDILPELAFEDTFYQFGYSSNPETTRRYLRGSIDFKTRYSGILGDDKTPGSHKYKHEVIPEVSYTVVPYLYQDFHPFFYGTLFKNGYYLPHYSSTQPVTEFDNLQFDYRDRMTDLNLITLGLTNVLIQKRVTKGVNEYRQVLKHRLYQSYDFYYASQPDFTPNNIYVPKFPWSELHSVLTLSYDFMDFSSDVSYYGYQNVIGQSTSLTLRDKYKNAVQIGYSKSFSPLVDPATGLITLPVDTNSASQAASLSTYFSTTYLDLGGSTSYDLGVGQFTTFSINGLLKPPGKCYGIGAVYSQVLNGGHSFLVTLPIFFGNGKSFTVGRPPGI